jgi:guanylate kinase
MVSINTDVAKETVIRHIQDVYEFEVAQCWPCYKGFDNSVFYVSRHPRMTDPEYVFKIVENQAEISILRSMRVSQNMGKFSILEYIKTIDGKLVTQVMGKASFLMKCIQRCEPKLESDDEVLEFATFIAKFHCQDMIPCPTYSASFGEQELRTIERCWTVVVQEGLQEFFPGRWRFYCSTVAGLIGDERLRYVEGMSAWPSTIGITHGDLNTTNVIKSPNQKLFLIDFDAVDERGFQLVDILEVISKSCLAVDDNKARIFLGQYFAIVRGVTLENEELELILKSCRCWLAVFALRSMLSTEHYTFECQKFSAKWSLQNASGTLVNLRRCFDNCVAADPGVCQYMIFITGPSTVGKTTLAALLSSPAVEPSVVMLPITTTRAKRQDDDPACFVNVDERQFRSMEFFIHSENYGIQQQHISSFLDTGSSVGVCICGPEEMMQLQKRVLPHVKYLKILLRRCSALDEEIAQLAPNIHKYFQGSMAEQRIDTDGRLSQQFYHNNNFTSEFVDLILTREFTAEQWARIIIEHIPKLKFKAGRLSSQVTNLRTALDL